MNEHQTALQRAAEVGGVVRVSRDHLGVDDIYGIPLEIGELDIGENLVLLHRIENWTLAGYQVVRLRDITEVRRGRFDHFHDRVIDGEGLRARVGPPTPEVPITSWRTVFEALRASGRFAMVHAEEDDEAPLYLGPVIEVGHDGLLLRYVDAEGLPADELTDVRFDEVTNVEFDDPYSTVLSRHVQWDVRPWTRPPPLS